MTQRNYRLVGWAAVIGGFVWMMDWGVRGPSIFGDAARPLGWCFLGLFGSLWPWRSKLEAPQPDEGATAVDDENKSETRSESSEEKIVGQMLTDGRHALLLRPQITQHLNLDQHAAALSHLHEQTAVIPDGDVIVQHWTAGKTPGSEEHDRLVTVDAFYLDRHLITNRQFQRFVRAGGYEELDLWDPAVVPAILQFVDRAGKSGPRFWTHGCYPAGEDDFPVVGISWFEAAAYSRWIGMRLPTNAEWTKAGAWPIPTDGARPHQRKFPWGESMNRQLANLWGSGPGRTCSVFDFDEASIGGVHQLIGNVWEWLATPFNPCDETGLKLVLSTPMKTICGGAFDTYFDSQATCQFQSGDDPMARKHNIGFRCALNFCDVAQSYDLDHAAPEHEHVLQGETVQ